MPYVVSSFVPISFRVAGVAPGVHTIVIRVHTNGVPIKVSNRALTAVVYKR